MNFHHLKKAVKSATAILKHSLFCRVFTIAFFALLIFNVSPSLADSHLAPTDADGKTLYVIGNPDFYPIEYYNSKTHTYEGLMPQLFSELKVRTGMKFEYINGASEYNIHDAHSKGAHIYSSHIIGSDKDFIRDEVQVISYTYKGKSVKVGMAFSERASESVIKTIKGEMALFNPGTMNGYLISGLHDSRQKGNATGIVLSLACAVLISLTVINGIRFKKQKETRDFEKMTDSETGIGNLAHFDDCYSQIPDKDRNKYVLFYIIIESSNLQVYHRDSAFNEAVRHTADLLRTHENEGGLCARITESGFMLAVKSEAEDAQEVIVKNICSDLNSYFRQTGTERNSFFRVSAYRLQETDNSSELVIFHMRRACNRLLGTETQSVICDPRMTQREAEEKNLIEKIVRGFDNREFKLYMQFIVDKSSKKIVSAEALSRWHDPEDGVVSPFRYIGVMERSGLILRLDYYMFDLVCQQLHKWTDTAFDPITISCNITRITISEVDFVDRIREISSRYIFDRSKLIMEITEDAIEKNRNVAMSNIERVKKMGFRIALDDMGSGYTSFMNLCDYPIDIVKIDRDILLKTDTPKGRDLFTGIVALAHSLGFTVVCEGVETEEQNSLIEETDCNYIQGWYYFTPQPHRECEKIAREYPPGIK